MDHDANARHSFETGQNKMIDEANALSKDILDLISSARRICRDGPGFRYGDRPLPQREVFVALANVAAYEIKQWYKPEARDEAVE
jgi:hypothetical protein